MARPRTLKPKYRLHKPTDRAYVVIDGRISYLGRYGTQESRDKYDRLIGEWIACGRAPLPNVDPKQAGSRLTVSTLISAWYKWAWQRYKQPGEAPDGKRPAGELGNYFDVLAELHRLYGPTAASEFDPFRLEAFREALARDRQFTDKNGATVRRTGWSRNVINRQMSRLRAVFKWSASRKLIPVEVYDRLRTLEALAHGIARETDPVRPAPDADIEATIPHLSRHVAAMVQVQRRTGMRPGEVCAMRRNELDRSGPVWLYSPATHKTKHRGKPRVISIGPKAQAVLETFPPRTLDPAEYVFSPIDAEPTERKRGPGARKPGDHYTVAAYRRAIARACDVAGVDAWHPNQLRHSLATEARKKYGLDAVQVLLSHSSREMSELYAEPDTALAQRVMLEIG